MTDYENYINNLGIPYSCLVLTVPRDNMPRLNSLVKHNNGKIISQVPILENNNYNSWNLKTEILANHYNVEKIKEIALENGYALKGYELDLTVNRNLDEKLDQRLRDYIY